MHRKSRRAFLIGGLAGLLVACGLWGTYLIFGNMFGEAELLMWPTSVFLMATSDAGGLSDYLVVLGCIIGNGLTYGTVSLLFSAIARRLGWHTGAQV